MQLESIGFYTLNDERAARSSSHTDLSRCELILTGRCNFSCPYCRGVGGPELPWVDAFETLAKWCMDGLRNVRFSGGEPTLWRDLPKLCEFASQWGVDRVAISTNGSAARDTYSRLIDCGVNDCSVSLDACCAAQFGTMTGGRDGYFQTVVDNLKWLSERIYVTVGVVLTDENASAVQDVIRLADNCGVADIRVIPAAQGGSVVESLEIDAAILARHPILRYRLENARCGRPVR